MEDEQGSFEGRRDEMEIAEELQEVATNVTLGAVGTKETEEVEAKDTNIIGVIDIEAQDVEMREEGREISVGR